MNNTGQIGEDLAGQYLLKNGYTILEQNLKAPFGEIDIIAEKENYKIFIEVKSRTSENYLELAHSLYNKQIAHLRKAAVYYFVDQNIYLTPIRFDLIAIKIDPAARNIDKLKHFKNIID